MEHKILADSKLIQLLIDTLSIEILEHNELENTCLIGIQPRGISLTQRIVHNLRTKYQIEVEHGCIDNTFFRDDFRRRDTPLKASTTDINFVVEGKKVILIDDVLFTGRSVKAALNALQAFGRPSEIELLVLVNRRCHRDIPIEPNYKGLNINTIPQENVVVKWQELEGKDEIYLKR